jgi:hypothetical protein
MGTAPAVEYAQLMTSALLGKHHVVSAEFQHDPNVRVDVFVDGARSTSNDASLLSVHTASVLTRANSLNVKIKHAESVSILTEHEFIGGMWDFSSKTIRLSDKNKNKIASLILSDPSLDFDPFEVERLVGRLLFASGLLQIPLARFYWVIKWVAKLINKLNRGIVSRVRLPPSVFFSLIDWQQTCLSTHKITFGHNPNFSGTVFSDASISGWGAVFVSSTNRVFIVGGKWSNASFTHRDIAFLEAEAARRGIICLQRFLANTHFKLILDNSSIVYALSKGFCKNLSINACLSDVFSVCDRLDATTEVEWISTHDNIADPISRLF